MSQNFVAQPGGPLRGHLQVPGDKSISHRALMLGALATGETEVSGFLPGEDCLATLAALEAMGVRVKRAATDRVRIHGAGLRGLRAAATPLDMGNSGTAMRLFAGLLAGQDFDSVLTGDTSLSQRPMERVATPLRQMGAVIETRAGCAPLEIRGGQSLRGIEYEMPVASAQVKSAVLLAGLYADGETSVTEPAVTRDHTERMLVQFGVPVEREGATLRVRGGAELQPAPIRVPGDLSSAAFFLLAACITPGSDITIKNVGLNPTRTGVLRILELMGADLEISETATVPGGEPVGSVRARGDGLRGIEVPPELVPLAIDEFPVLFIAAALATGTTIIRGAEELRHKESDRIMMMVRGLQTLGASVEEFPDGARILGGGLDGGVVDSAGDHRVAMAFAMAANAARAPIRILNTANVSTSFPGFQQHAISVGLNVDSETGVNKNSVTDVAPVVALDGPGGAGKGTIARAVAAHFGWHLLDSGALYRLVALSAVNQGVALDDAQALAGVARELDVQFDPAADERILLDGQDVTAAIREERCSQGASIVAAVPEVRAALVERQRAFRRPPGLVADGRDMGAVIFPDAGLKVFLSASVEERARRRYKQLKDKGIDVSLPALSKDMADRDRRDAERAVAPLRPGPDARELDTTDMSIEAVVAQVIDWATAAYPAVAELRTGIDGSKPE